ncbi:uncharacterized protein SPAPADRAFT_58608, partial [Spathaspora passalidarum NRRL Y-27907]
HTVLLLDHEGANKSKLTKNDLTLADLAQNVSDTLHELSLQTKKIILIGHSMSGMLVNYINIHSNLPIYKSVLIGPVHPTPKLTQIFLDRITSLKESQSLIPFSNTIPEAATGDKCSDLKKAFIRQLIQGNTVDGYIANCHAIASGASYDLDYSKVKSPTLVLYGTQDNTAPYTGCVEVIANGIPDVKAVPLDVGHWLVIEDDESVLKEIVEFI